VTASCPDDLLLRVRDGAPPLLPAERQLLEGHLAGCASCRMSRALLDAVGPLPAPGAGDLALAERLLDAWPATPDARRAPIHDRDRERGRARALGLWWAAAILLLITAGASAAWYRAASPRRSVTPPVAPPPELPQAPPRSTHRPAEAPLDPQPPPEAPPLETPPPAAVPAVPAVRRAPPPAAPSASALFQRANQARAGGDRVAAAALYRQLQVRHPATPEARLSFYSLGEMLLGTGDARAALGQFREYLRGGDDTLAEEALVRAARACQQLGQTGEEVSLWRRLLDDFPRSDYRWRAEDRLRALRDGAP
jgi:TolA-binding protein